MDEGASFALTLDNASVPGYDGAVTFTYQFDCDGDGVFELSSGNATGSCTAGDGAGTRTVHGRVQDQDGDASTYAATVTIQNVAPTATFAATPSSPTAGASFTLSLTEPVDVAADLPGLTYTFDCGDGNGYSAASATSSATCATTGAGSRSVRGRVTDKDGGTSEYTATVTVTAVVVQAAMQLQPDRVSLSTTAAVNVILLSQPELDALTIDLATTRLVVNGVGEVAPLRRGTSYVTSVRDVNGDGRPDRLISFQTTALVAAGLTTTNASLELRGTAAGGVTWRAADPTPPVVAP